MKEIIISIKPQWIKEIFYNNKIIELRKTYPKCELPIKAYIYCTKSGEELIINNQKYNGKIVGEIIINKIHNIIIENDNLFINNVNRNWNELENYSKVNKEEIKNYFKNKGYGWQINNFKIYKDLINPENILGINFDNRILMSWSFVN